MLGPKSRVVLAIEGTSIGVRLVPHKTDSSKLVLKSPHPEGAGALLQLGGLAPGEATQGSEYFRTEVDKKEFLAALPGIIAKVLEVNVPTRDRPMVLSLVESDDPHPTEPCGCGHCDPQDAETI